MDIAGLLAAEPSHVTTWAHAAYRSISGQQLLEAEWRSLFEHGVGAALRRGDTAGLHAMLWLAANYFDSIGDQFGCLPYIEETMQRVESDPPARAVVLGATHEILVGNS